MKQSGTRSRLVQAAGSLLAAALFMGASAPPASAQAAAGTTGPAQPATAQAAGAPADGAAAPGNAQSPAAPAPAPATPASEAAPEAQPAGKVQEIVVTATRREAALSKVPVSVSAFTQESMDEKGIKDFTDVARYTPGVTIDATGTGTNSISIRGISSSGGSGTTGIYIDDTPIQIHSLGFNADDTLPKTFDLERVEVLRGPQGTLFGAGSEGGTVRYILTQPSLSKSSIYARSEVAFTQGGDPSYEAGVAGGVPLIDGTLGVRASIWYRRDGGWIDRIDPFTLATVDAKSNWDATYVARLAARWAVTPDVTLTPSLLYQHRNRNDISVFWPQNTGANGQTVTSDPSSHRFLNADPSARPEPDHYFLPVLKAEAELGGVSMISNTSYYTRDDLSGYEGTLYNLGYYQTLGTRVVNGVPIAGANQFDPNLQFANSSYYPLIDQYGLHLPPGIQNYRSPASVINEQRTFTEEVRLQSNDPAAPLTWTTGVFYQFTRQVSLEQIYDPMVDSLFQSVFVECPAGAPCDPATGTPATATGSFGLGLFNGFSYYNYNTGHDRQVALFGEASYEVIPRVKLTAGARIAKTAFDFTHFATGTQNGTTTLNSGNKEETPFTPKLGVSFQADPNNLYYFTYAKGFRTGGDNAPIPSLLCPSTFTTLGFPVGPNSGSPATYNSDTVKSYEIGAKNRLFGSLRLASSAYYIKWSDIQQNVYLPGCGFQFTTNVGTAAAKGFDLQADWNATDSLSFESAIGYTNARYLRDASLVPGGAPIARAGDAVVGDSGVASPPWTVTIGALYEFTALDLPSYFRVDYQYESKSHFLTAAEDPGVSPTVFDRFAYTPPATTFVTMRAGARYRGWNVSAFVDNVFDTHPLLPPGGPNSHSDADPTAPAGQGVLIRNYTFRPRTIGLTAIFRM
ncbi:MAG TPA: TonB-dependent receptor [Burkholderiaceae bacterium]|nr:TonB-dependent receptor [Burkholderiaceae bacterium]